MAGNPESGLKLVDEALAQAQHTGERYYEAELYRLKGELVFLQSTGQRLSDSIGGAPVATDSETVANAESWFRQCIKTAHAQNAGSLELRGAISLHG